MKKHLIIFLFVSIFLYWCNHTKPVYIDFIEASQLLSKQIQEIGTKIEDNFFSGSKNMSISLQANWENKDFQFQSTFNISWDIFSWVLENEFLINLYTYFWDKKAQKETNISGNIDYKLQQDNIYFNIKDLSVDIWDWNYQWDLVSLIARNLQNKRIFIETKWKTQHILNDILSVLQILSGTSSFDFLDQVTYESKLSHKVQISPDTLDYINSNIDYKILDFKGLIIVNSKSDVELKIDSLIIKWPKEITINGLFWDNSGYISIKETNTPEKSYDFSRKISKKQTSFTFSQNQNYQDLIKLNINLYHKFLHDVAKNYIDWDLTISPLIIYWSDLEKEIEIDITGEQSFYKIPNRNILEPDSYIFLNQILWDEFSLQTLLQEDNNLNNKD